MQVVADTSVFNYLLLLDQMVLLPTLYGQIITPPVVLEVELPHPCSPAPVHAWVQHLTAMPEWLELRAPTRTPEADLLLLEAGERDTILVAQELQADLVFFRLCRLSDHRHAFFVLSACGYSACSKRHLSSVLIACMSARWPGSLSTPSCHKCRNSSSSF
jgi:hypothetical protein